MLDPGDIMKLRLLAFSFLLLGFSSPGYAIYFAGELTTSDALAIDEGFGDFYYDLYSLTVDDPVTMYIFMTPTAPFAPWLGYWDGDFSDAPDYNNPLPVDYETSDGAIGLPLIMSFDAMPGIEYQIMAATYFYNPTDLGTYNFFVLDEGRTNLGFQVSEVAVPAPQSWIIMMLGLLVLGVANKFGAFQATVLRHA